MQQSFYKILEQIAIEMVKNKETLTEKQALYILQQWLNPYDNGISDTFAEDFSLQNFW